MNYSKIILMLMIILFLPAHMSHSQDTALRIDIKPEHESVKNGAEISVLTRIINISQSEQKFEVWSCSYSESWVTDSPHLSLVAVSCKENAITKIVLKPGRVYENKLSIRVAVPAEEILVEDVTFKLGFKPIVWSTDSQKKENETSIIWSYPVTIKVKEK